MKKARQYGALPWVRIGDEWHVLLITRRRSGRWFVPKGWPEAGLSPRRLAALEAWEEAGIAGKMGKKPLGRFHYVKKNPKGRPADCEVELYPLKARRQYIDWPEKGQRRLRWVEASRAAAMIDNEELAALIRKFAARKHKKAVRKARRTLLKKLAVKHGASRHGGKRDKNGKNRKSGKKGKGGKGRRGGRTSC